MSCLLPLVAGLVLANASVTGTRQASLDTAEIRTAVTAQRTVRPDRAQFTIQFTAMGPTVRAAGQNVALRADSVRRALMTLGIARDSLVTGSTWYWWPQRIEVITTPRRIPLPPPGRGLQQAVDTIWSQNGVEFRPIQDTTYRAREILQVRLGDVSKVGAAMDAVLALRITEITGLQFGATDVTEARLSALREATTAARAQAEAMAGASGGRIGRVLSLSTLAEPDPYGGSVLFARDASVQSVMSGGQTEVTAPGVTVSVTVYGRWQLLER